MNEFSFINSIRQKNYKQSTVIKGIGDDAAVFRQPTEDIVTAVDTFVEDVHFSKRTMDPFYIGYRALAATISDLAAMGASPAFYLVSIAIPKSWSPDNLMGIYDGMKKIGNLHHLDLLGGDTVSGSELLISITAIGYVRRGKACYRSLASDGDVVFVTGTLGDSQAGFHILNGSEKYTNENYFIERHQMPSPRINFAKELSRLDMVALNDISDGIANEAAEIAEASKVNITIYADMIPVSPDFEQFPPSLQQKWKYYGGEDFELLGTISEAKWEIMKDVSKKTEVPVTKIGYVEYNGTDYGQVFLHEGNRKTAFKKHGYTHF